MSEPSCTSCRFGQFHPADEVMACIHPRVATPSLVTPNRLIGLQSGACRYSSRYCGPAGSWWEKKEC